MEWSLSQNKLLAFHRLMRTDKPIGALLLLWPTLWALWVASPGVPPLWILAVFVAGVWLMRAAGCVVNDYADRKFDGHVKRTARRPLPSGDVTEKEARTLFIVLVLLSFLLVLTLNTMTNSAVGGELALAWVYPFMKRYTHLPQVVLGAAFGWSIPMAFSAVQRIATAELLADVPSPIFCGRWPTIPSMRWWIAMTTLRSASSRRRSCLAKTIV